jgi:predicted DNA-binding protein
MNDPLVAVTIRLEEAQLKTLAALSERLGRPKAEVLRELVGRSLKEAALPILPPAEDLKVEADDINEQWWVGNHSPVIRRRTLGKAA